MDLSHLFAYFRQGQLYVRKEIHNMLGGQEQGGISTPRSAPCVFLFRKERASGYVEDDGWQLDGFYHFTGEGQSFDMEMTRGNKAVRDHRRAGKVLMLFESVKNEAGVYRFQGFMNCVDYYHKDIDALGNVRRIYVFRLAPIETYPTSHLLSQSKIATHFLDLRSLALEVNAPLAVSKFGHYLGPASDSLHLNYEENQRNEYHQRVLTLTKYVIQRANGFCECCGYPAPFYCENQNPYLEIHYLHGVGDYGIDKPSNLIALCPTCHRKAHAGKDKRNISAHLDAAAANVENALDKGILKLVTAAIIIDDTQRILAAQRKTGDLAGYWEFPGGQVKPGETLEQCLTREIYEELSLEITDVTPFMMVDYDYGTFFMRLYSFLCKARGTPVLREHAQIEWLEREDLRSLDWVPADVTIAEGLCNDFNL
ncbi:MAG: NUDIX domain-containing protein [Bacillota bacterium]